MTPAGEFCTLALPKGRLLSPSLRVLESSLDICIESLRLADRQLSVLDDENGLRHLLVKPSDVVTYVSEGAADLGIVGKDTLMEETGSVYELYDLGFGRCHVTVAAERELVESYPDPSVLYRSRGMVLRVATKYPRIARKHFDSYDLPTQIIPLSGSVELAPAAGLADIIVDLVATGRTLAANGLVEVERVAEVTARLIANPVSLKVDRRIGALLQPLSRKVLSGKGDNLC